MKKAYSLTEIVIVIIILGFIAIIVSKNAFVNSQKQFDIKYRKIATAITANIKKGLITRTGFKYDDYVANSNAFYTDVTNGLNGSTCTDCWSSTINVKDTNISSYSKFLLNDKTVLAIQNSDGTNIFIDVNGVKGPNEFGKDIYEYKYSE